MRVQAAPPSHFSWLTEKVGCAITAHASAIEAVDATGRVRGMVLYDGPTPNSVQCHMAVEAPIVWRHLLRPAFSYPFEEGGKGLLIGIVPGFNKASLSMTRRLGFREAYRIADGHSPGVDLHIFEMRRDECPHLQRKAA